MQAELVKTWMRPNPICAALHTTLPETLKLMEAHAIHHRQAADGSGKLVGIVSRGDLRGA